VITSATLTVPGTTLTVPESRFKHSSILPNTPITFPVRPVPLVLFPQGSKIGYTVVSLMGNSASTISLKVKTGTGTVVRLQICKEPCLGNPCQQTLREWQLLKGLNEIPHLLKVEREITLPHHYSVNEGKLIVSKKEGHSHAILTESLSPIKISKVKEILGLAIQALETLASLHEKRIVHLNISPSSMSYERSSELKIFNFEHAQAIENIDPKLPFGQENYWTPEQMLAMPYGASVDVWALGASFFEFFTTKPLIAIEKTVKPAQLVVDYFWNLIYNFGPLPKDFIIPRDYQCLFTPDRSLVYPPSKEVAKALDLIHEARSLYPAEKGWKARILQKGAPLLDAMNLIHFLEPMLQPFGARINPRNALKQMGKAPPFSITFSRGSIHITCRIIKELGFGGYGTVLEAETPKGSHVAVKVHHANVECWQQALREAEMLKILKEAPHFVHIREAGYLSHLYFRNNEGLTFDPNLTNVYSYAIVTDLLPSNTYQKYIASCKGKVTELIASDVMRMMQQGLKCLVYLHGKGIAHLDLKPENMVDSDEGEFTILDVGCADWINQIKGVRGTLNFRAPEIMLFMSYGANADIWAFGASLFELYTGYPLHAIKESEDLRVMTADYLWLCIQNFGNFSEEFIEKVPADCQHYFHDDGSPAYLPSKQAYEVSDYFRVQQETYITPLWETRIHLASKAKADDSNDAQNLIELLRLMFSLERKYSAKEILEKMA